MERGIYQDGDLQGKADKARVGQGSQTCRQGSGCHDGLCNLSPVKRKVRTGWGDVRSPGKVVGSMDFRSSCWHTRENKLKK